MREGVYNIETIDNVSVIERYLKPYCSLVNYRQLFMSKEWIKSYCTVYKPNKMVFVYNTYTQEYILFERQGSTLCCLGDPLNDFNLCNIREAHELEEWLHIIEQIKLGEQVSVHLNCVTSPLFKQSYNEVFWGLVADLMIHEEQQVSAKLKKLQRKYNNTIQYHRITPDNPNFVQLLDQLLFGRKIVLYTKAPDDNSFSLDENFVAFIRLLCTQPSLHESVFIDYGKEEDQIVSIGLYFRNHNFALFYLRWCLHLSTRVSYGLLQDLWSINQCKTSGYKVVDFSRGDEPYKYRLGLNEYKLYNYVI